MNTGVYSTHFELLYALNISQKSSLSLLNLILTKNTMVGITLKSGVVDKWGS